MNISVNEVCLTINMVKILNKISFVVPECSFTCILGPNGSGKSSILGVIAKEITDFDGTVTGVTEDDITYLPQNLESPPFLNVFELAALGFHGQDISGKEKKSRTLFLLDRFGVGHLGSREFATLSSGEKQRTWLAFALAQSRNVILMDEPFSAIDLTGRKRFFQMLKEITDSNKTLVVATHDVDMANEYSDNIVRLTKSGTVEPT